MQYDFLDNNIDKDNVILPESDKINSFVLKNNTAEIIKFLDFLDSDEKFLYVHGFLGTGKRQIINYAAEFLNKDVIKLEYYCKQATVCDDILLSFINKIEKINLSKAVSLNVKITTLAIKFQQYISSINKPFIIILNSVDDISDSNFGLVQNFILNALKNQNVKVVLSTKGMNQELLGDRKPDRKLFIQAFSSEIFNSFVKSNNIKCSEKDLEDFYKYTRGYYYYTALSMKIMQAMKLSLAEFIEKVKLSEMNYDTFLGATYLNLVPQTIRNFLWFLIFVRHGVSLNALAVWDLYDEFSVDYLKTNLMIFEFEEILYVQDYFLQNIDISVPKKTEIKLHKYIIKIYEKELKQPLESRSVLISRQALRAEIEYHKSCIENLEQAEKSDNKNEKDEVSEDTQNNSGTGLPKIEQNLENKIKDAEKYEEKEDITSAIEAYLKIIETENLDKIVLNELRHRLGNLYKKTGEYHKSQHYFELVEKYFIADKEAINLNYLYYEQTELFYAMYKTDRAIETIKKVIYSVDTPQSLMVDACTLLGNIYAEKNNPQEAYSYYQKALDSLDENISSETLAELYFKYALANDDKGDTKTAFEYYNKCLSLTKNKYKSAVYSNMGSCYYENNNLSDALDCFKKAYSEEKLSNNYEGIYYTAINIAKILTEQGSQEALDFLLEAKQSAEFLNDDNYILEASVALGDYYYNIPSMYQKALNEYNTAKNAAMNLSNINMAKIEQRIKDMEIRISDLTNGEV